MFLITGNTIFFSIKSTLDKKRGGDEKKMALEIKTESAQNTEKSWANRNERQCLTRHSSKIRSLKSLSPHMRN